MFTIAAIGLGWTLVSFGIALKLGPALKTLSE